MSITGTKQGLITAGAFTEDSVGNTYQEGHEDQVMVQGFNHEVIIPRDPQSGQPTGQRVHKPVVITKVFDKASPLLLAALTSGERLTKVEIQWYRTSAAGTQEHYYTTVLEDAIIVDIKDYMHNCQDPGNAHFTHLEDVHFTYRKITWTHEVSGTSGSDDWRSRALVDARYLRHRHPRGAGEFRQPGEHRGQPRRRRLRQRGGAHHARRRDVRPPADLGQHQSG